MTRIRHIETTTTRKSQNKGEPQHDPVSVRRSESIDARESVEDAIALVALERSRAGKALQILTGRLMAAQEEERRRIGRELHDGLNQQLAMFAVELGLLARQAPAEATALRESILDLRQRAEGLSDDLRHFSHQLHPAVLEHLGLYSALRSLCADFTRHSGIRALFRVEDETKCVSADIAICLYRITQEALRNVLKHSGAKEVWIRIRQNQDSIQLSIIDKGGGFKVNSSPTAGLGLVSMKERVQILQGHFHIQSAPNEGTTIRITVPISWKEHKSVNEYTRSKAHASAG